MHEIYGISTFRERVWFPTSQGFASRPATRDDAMRRALLMELLDAETPEHRKAALRLDAEPVL